VELIRALLGDDVDNTARRTTELGVVTAGDDLGLLNELVGQVRRQATKRGVRRVDALDDVRVLGRRRAADRRTVDVILRTGRRAEHAAERTTRRNVPRVVVRQRHAGLRRALVDDGHRAGDLDDLRALADRRSRLLRIHRDVDDGFLADLDEHVRARERLVLVIDRERVEARRQGGEEVLTGFVGDHDLLADESRRRRDNRRADRGLTGSLVLDLAACGADVRARLSVRIGGCQKRRGAKNAHGPKGEERYL